MKKVSKAVEKDDAALAARAFERAGDPLTFVSHAGDDIKKSYGKLKTDEARREFWDSFEFSMEKTAPSGWAKIYEALEMLRREEWYWKERYKTFEDYLREEQAFSFRQFDALEEHYQFAMMAYPAMFSADRRKQAKVILSRRKAEAEQALAAKLPGASAHGGARRGAGRKNNQVVAQNGQQLEFSPAAEVDLDSQSAEFQAGFKSQGSTNRFYRFRVLKKKAPKVAQKVIDGDYTKQKEDGVYFVDLAAAEVDAEKRYPGRFKKFTQKSRAQTPMQKAQKVVSQMTPDQLREFKQWLKTVKV